MVEFHYIYILYSPNTSMVEFHYIYISYSPNTSMVEFHYRSVLFGLLPGLEQSVHIVYAACRLWRYV